MAIAHFVIQFPICTGTVHTIAYSKSLYKVEEVAEQTETKSLTGKGEAANLVSLTSMAGKQSEEMRQSVDRLLYERVLPLEGNHSHFTFRATQGSFYRQATHTQRP